MLFCCCLSPDAGAQFEKIYCESRMKYMNSFVKRIRDMNNWGLSVSNNVRNTFLYIISYYGRCRTAGRQ